MRAFAVIGVSALIALTSQGSHMSPLDILAYHAPYDLAAAETILRARKNKD